MHIAINGEWDGTVLGEALLLRLFVPPVLQAPASAVGAFTSSPT
jgi:hypothetical protein